MAATTAKMSFISLSQVYSNSKAAIFMIFKIDVYYKIDFNSNMLAKTKRMYYFISTRRKRQVKLDEIGSWWKQRGGKRNSETCGQEFEIQ